MRPSFSHFPHHPASTNPLFSWVPLPSPSSTRRPEAGVFPPSPYLNLPPFSVSAVVVPAVVVVLAIVVGLIGLFDCVRHPTPLPCFDAFVAAVPFAVFVVSVVAGLSADVAFSACADALSLEAFF